MPCSDSSSSFTLWLDPQEKFGGFEFAKITCGKEISAQTGLSDHLKGKPLKEVLSVSYREAVDQLHITDQENQFILYLEWDALRSAIAHYLGQENPDIDHNRCRIASIEQTEKGTEIALVILPPKEMPKILPCGLADQLENDQQK